MSKIAGVHYPSEMKNLAINGAFDFWQRIEGGTQTLNSATATSTYNADMWVASSSGTTVKNYSNSRSVAALPTFAQSGFQSTYSANFTMITGIASPAATDIVNPFQYRMEGLDYERIHGKTVTFGFWAFATVPGTYNFGMTNSGTTRAYATSFVISAASTWQFISITVPLDTATSGWNFDNSLAFIVLIGSYGGSSAVTSTVNQWATQSNFIVSSGLTNWMGTSGNSLNIAQFSIVEGPLGFGAKGFQRTGKSYQQELALCQRYFEKSYDLGVAPGAVSSNGYWSATSSNTTSFNAPYVPFKVSKRIQATGMTGYNPSSGAAGNFQDISIGSANGNIGFSAVNANGFNFFCTSSFTAAHAYVAHWIADAGL